MRSKNDSAWDVDYREAMPVVQKRGTSTKSGLQVGSYGSPDTTLAAGCIFTGDIELTGRAQLNCKLECEISSGGELIIGEEADIKANIFGHVVISFGRVVGDIGLNRRRAHSLALSLAHGLCRLVARPRIVDDHVTAAAREPERRGATDPRSAARDNRDLVLQFHDSISLSRLLIRFHRQRPGGPL